MAVYLLWNYLYASTRTLAHRIMHGVHNASVLRAGEISWRAYIAVFVASACRAAPLISLIKLATDRPACPPPPSLPSPALRSSLAPSRSLMSVIYTLFCALISDLLISRPTSSRLPPLFSLSASRRSLSVKCAALSYLKKYYVRVFLFFFRFFRFQILLTNCDKGRRGWILMREFFATYVTLILIE